MYKSNKRLVQTIWLTIFTISSLNSRRVLCSVQAEVSSFQDGAESIEVLDSSIGIKYSGVKDARLIAPQSRLANVYFDRASLNLAARAFDPSANKTKQSQDFETHLNKPSSPAPPSSASDAQSEASNILASSQASTIAIATTVATTITPNPGELPSTGALEITPSGPVPVGSKTIRRGSEVSCGEANPNGNSNKKLVLDRIVGGHKTEPGEFPFQVRLNIRSRRGSGICGGVILNERYILTAAHCMTACTSQHLATVTIETGGVHPTIGDHSIRAKDGELEMEVEKIIPHENYDACNFYANDHDIALIKTTEPIEYRFSSDGYGSINRPCMPSPRSEYRDGEPVIVSGWGVMRENSGSLSNILRYVQVGVVNVTRCQETYGNRVTKEHLCAGYQAGGKDSCQGDSGGPLVRLVENRYELAGIVSFGYGCGQPGAPGVYTRVASYLDWIASHTMDQPEIEALSKAKTDGDVNSAVAAKQT